MTRTITIPDELQQRIDQFYADTAALSDAEASGPPWPSADDWAGLDDEARDILDMMSGLLSIDECAGVHPDPVVDGTADQRSIEITVRECTTHTLYLHPDRLPDDYDIDADIDGVVDAAIADATSHNLGDVTVTDRETVTTNPSSECKNRALNQIV